MALRKEPLTVYGDGKQTRSFQVFSDLNSVICRRTRVENLLHVNYGKIAIPFCNNLKFDLGKLPFSCCIRVQLYM
ncbi:hypothetical protein K1719_027429 [Acacia pycnantha]|nr:hypothetical protein K1719_027429 [Acacia pycnantha]